MNQLRSQTLGALSECLSGGDLSRPASHYGALTAMNTLGSEVSEYSERQDSVKNQECFLQVLEERLLPLLDPYAIALEAKMAATDPKSPDRKACNILHGCLAESARKMVTVAVKQ